MGTTYEITYEQRRKPEKQVFQRIVRKRSDRVWKRFEGVPTKWSKPYLRPLFRLGELTTPTTFSASSPDRHGSDIEELRSI
jgi:hypothetical protein